MSNCPKCQSPELLELTHDADEAEFSWWCIRCGTAVVLDAAGNVISIHSPQGPRRADGEERTKFYEAIFQGVNVGGDPWVSLNNAVEYATKLRRYLNALRSSPYDSQLLAMLDGEVREMETKFPIDLPRIP